MDEQDIQLIKSNVEGRDALQDHYKTTPQNCPSFLLSKHKSSENLPQIKEPNLKIKKLKEENQPYQEKANT